MYARYRYFFFFFLINVKLFAWCLQVQYIFHLINKHVTEYLNCFSMAYKHQPLPIYPWALQWYTHSVLLTSFLSPSYSPDESNLTGPCLQSSTWSHILHLQIFRESRKQPGRHYRFGENSRSDVPRLTATASTLIQLTQGEVPQ